MMPDGWMLKYGETRLVLEGTNLLKSVTAGQVRLHRKGRNISYLEGLQGVTL
jgi:hypothetical protein